jgi:hypothetical protein
MFPRFMMGDADLTQAVLSVTGFSFLLLICAFESDVSPDRFLEDKLMVTAWFLERMGAESVLDFPLDVYHTHYRRFIRKSKLRPLFEEFDRFENHGADKIDGVGGTEDFPYKPWWAVVHMVGALAYLGCVAAGIILNDVDDDDIYGVAYVMTFSFTIFSIMGYLTGTYMPLLRPLRGLVLVWNPFCRDRHFYASLREAVLDYKLGAGAPPPPRPLTLTLPEPEDGATELDAGPRRRRSSRRLSKAVQKEDTEITEIKSEKKTVKKTQEIDISAKRDELIRTMEENSSMGEKVNSFSRAIFRYIEREPEAYLRHTSLVFVSLELVAMLTPAVALGMQWVTALCPGAPVQSFLDLLSACVLCLSVSREQCEMSMREHCIVRI